MLQYIKNRLSEYSSIIATIILLLLLFVPHSDIIITIMLIVMIVLPDSSISKTLKKILG